VNNTPPRGYLEDGADFHPCLQLGVIAEIGILGDFVICDRDLYLIEVENVGVYAVKFILFHCLDELLES